MRPGLIALLVTLLGGACTNPRAVIPTDITVRTVPDAVYRLADPGRASTESWHFNLVVADARNRAGIRPLRAEMEVLTGATVLETIVLPEATLEQMKLTSYLVTPETDELSTRRAFPLEEAFDFRLSFVGKPTAWKADRVRIHLTLEFPDSGTVTKSLDVPIRTFSQKTRLVFPLRGPAIVTQGRINNAGHSGHANQFALDVMGLNAEYGPMVDGPADNTQYAGWGREIIAPAGGTVVYTRNDVPDNPPDADPRDVYSNVPDPLQAIAGNCVVIDHGNGEFSVLMHLQQGSVSVQIADSVRQGQAIARLGNSGDSSGAHLHYQLQDGPELFRANSLPAAFDNLKDVNLARGVYFDAQ